MCGLYSEIIKTVDPQICTLPVTLLAEAFLLFFQLSPHKKDSVQSVTLLAAVALRTYLHV